MLQAVIFDLGGVLINVDPERTVQHLAQATGQPLAACANVLADPLLRREFQLGQISSQDMVRHLSAKLEGGLHFAQFVDAWNRMVEENRQTTWVLERLRARYTLLVLTNTNPLHDAYIRETWPVFQHVHHWIASCQVGYCKPETQIFQLALRRAQVPAHAAVFIDDTKEHTDAARRLGIQAIHFAPGLSLEKELAAAGLHV